MFTLMTTWHSGRERLAQRLHEQSIELEAFLASIFSAPPLRVPGTAVFLNAEPDVAPNALLHNLKHNKVLHETNLFVTVRHHEVPWIGFDRRVEAQPLGHDCWRVVLHFGFKNDPDVPQALQLLRSHGVPLDDMETSYFLSREIVLPRHDEGLMHWRNKLFAGMHRNAASIADFLHLPANRVVELGAQIEI
jgi:KUP system potassium uptake protein